MPLRSSSLTPILVACCLGFLVVQLDVSVVNVGLGALKEAFGTDLTGLQWVINSYALIFSALLILGGACGDKWGAKSTFTAGFATFTLGSIGCGLSDSMTMLVAMRMLQGVGAAFLVPTSLTLIRLSFANPDHRRSAVALWGACGGIALAAGPVIGGLLIDFLGWRSVFLINVPIGILAIVLISRYAPASPRMDKKVDAGGQVSIAISLAALTYALTESSGEGWTALTLSSLVGAAFFLLVFVLVERHVKAPMLPAHLAKNRVLVSMSLAGAVINLTFYGTVFVFSIYFQTILHYDAFETGLSFVPLTAVLTLSTLMSSRIARTISARRIIITGFIIQVIGFLALSQIGTQPSFWILNGALMLVGIGSACSVPSITNSMLAAVTRNDAGIASGLMASARQLGGVIGVAVFGTMIATADAESYAKGMSNAMLLSALTLMVCIGAILLLTRHPVAALDAQQAVRRDS